MSESFIPHLRLFCDVVFMDQGEDYQQDFREVRLPLGKLTFNYDGTEIAASSRSSALFRASAEGLQRQARDIEGENAARRLLETFGLLDLSCLEDCAARSSDVADYIVDIDSSVDALVAFGKVAVPRLKALGWQVHIDAGYDCHVAQETGPWTATVEPGTEEGWFDLQLGVEADGQYVNLLPLIVRMLETDPEGLNIDALTRGGRPFTAVPLGDNRYLPIERERLRKILEILLELYDRPDVSAGLALRADRMPTLAGLDGLFVTDGESTLRWQDQAGLAAMSRELGHRSAIPTSAPAPDLDATLRPYQQEGVDWLQHLRACDTGGILADDMGLGKTLQTIAHILKEHEGGARYHPVLVVAPTSLMGNWQRELNRFAPRLRVLLMHGAKRHDYWDRIGGYNVVLTTYSLVHRDQERFSRILFHLLVLDEAHTIKNPRSKVHRAVLGLRARHRLCLTGTPIENNLTEMWSLFEFLMPGCLGSVEYFRQMFQQPIEVDGSVGRLAALRARVSPFILRRMKTEVAAELPAKTEMLRSIELRGDQRDLYESIRLSAHNEVRKAIRDKGMANSTIDVLGALLKLRQVCCDPRLVGGLEAARGVRRSAKYETLFTMLDELLGQGRRILIFSQFTTMLSLIGRGLAQERIRHVVLTGATRDRDAEVQAFQNGEADVFLLSLKAGGTGLNLTRADTVIHYDPWWNPAIQAQATDRAYRIGQTRPVFAYSLIVTGSVEERIVALQQRKRLVADRVLQTGQNVASLSPHDIDDLFAPMADQEPEELSRG